MATKKPLVYYENDIDEIHEGDELDATVTGSSAADLLNAVDGLAEIFEDEVATYEGGIGYHDRTGSTFPWEDELLADINLKANHLTDYDHTNIPTDEQIEAWDNFASDDLLNTQEGTVFSTNATFPTFDGGLGLIDRSKGGTAPWEDIPIDILNGIQDNASRTTWSVLLGDWIASGDSYYVDLTHSRSSYPFELSFWTLSGGTYTEEVGVIPEFVGSTTLRLWIATPVALTVVVGSSKGEKGDRGEIGPIGNIEDTDYISLKVVYYTKTTIVDQGDVAEIGSIAWLCYVQLPSLGSPQAKIVVTPGASTLSTNLTIPSTVTIEFPRGAILSIDAGITLTISGKLIAGIHQIFSGDGSVSASTNSVVEAHPIWFGALGTSDDAPVMQKALDAFRVVRIPVGNYYIDCSTPLNISSDSVVILSSGAALRAKADAAVGGLAAGGHYGLLSLSQVSNVVIKGEGYSRIIGDALTHHRYACTMTTSDNKVYLASHGLATEQRVLFEDVTAGGISEVPTFYFIRKFDNDYFYLYDTADHAKTGGATGLITITSDGIGNMIYGEFLHGIKIYRCTNTLIRDIDIYYSWGDGIYIGGTSSSYSNGVFIRNCRSVSNRRQGISVTSAKNVRLLDNRISGTTGTEPSAGIDLEPNGSCIVEDIIISGNVIYDNDGYGITGGGTDGTLKNIIITDNLVYGNGANDDEDVFARAGINCVAGSKIIVDNNILESNGSHGIRVVNSSGFKLGTNFISGATQFGVYIYNSTMGTIKNNDVNSSGKIGIYLTESSSYNLVEGNTVRYSGWDGIRVNTSPTVKVLNNFSVGNSTDSAVYSNILIKDGCDYNVVVGNTCREGTGGTKPIAGITSEDTSGTVVIKDNDCYDGGTDYGIYNNGNVAYPYESPNRDRDGSDLPFVRDTALYDFTVHGGAKDTEIKLKALPDNAVIARAWYEVIVKPTSGGSATISIGVTGDLEGIVADTAIASYTAGFHDGLPDSTAANFTTKTSGVGNVILKIGTANLTAGKIRVYYEFLIGV